MSIFKFTNPANGQPFEIKGPPTLTEAQARQIFNQQLDAGSLVGFKPGDTLSAATQAADGLKSALSQVTQAASGTGSSATGVLQGALTTAANGLASAAGLPNPLAGGKSVAASTINGIGGAINTSALSGAADVVTSGISLPNFTKQAPALASIGNLSVPDVTATLAQANKLVGQAANQVSNTLGVGKFGLNASQLETAGLIKPGIAQSFLASGTNSLTSVLKSPTVWTGKDGIKSLTSLLDSVSKQDAVQQTLMTVGKNALDQVGIPTNKLNATALSGTLTNAAKSVPDTVKWAQGLPLPTDVKSDLNKVAGASAFAVNFTNSKVPEEFKAQVVPPVAADTVDRDTLNAAASRVTGNSKIPAVAYDSKPARVDIVEYGADVNAATNLSVTLLAELQKLNRKIAPSNTIAEFTSAKQQLEALQIEVADNQNELLTLESIGRAVKQQYGTNPQQALIDRAKDRIKTILQLIQNLIEAIDGELTKLTTE
jgi:hypothetical protein